MTTSTKQLQDQIESAKKTLAELETKAAATINTPAPTNYAPYGNRSNSDEQRLLNAFGCADIKSLLTVDTSKFYVEPMLKQQVVQLKKMFDVSRLHAQICERDGWETREQQTGEAPLCRTILTNRAAKSFDLGNRIKAFGSTVVGAGDEFVQTLVSENYMAEFELEFKVASMFPEINMPSNPFRMPVIKDFTTARRVAEGAAAVESQFATGFFEFDAVRMVDYALIPDELNEDSVVQFIGLARDNAVKAVARAEETSILNGDITATHMDANVTLSNDARKFYPGLRKLALANSATVDFLGVGPTEAKLAELNKKADRFGVNPAECCYIVSPSTYAYLRNLPSVVTVDKFGPMATVKSGALASYGGIPIIVSQYVPQNLNNAGVVPATASALTAIHLVNYSRFMIGRRRPIRVVAQKDTRVEFERTQIAGYQRIDFKGFPQSLTELSTVLGINVLV
jgi:HK97 family phage major capsid protein